MCNRKEGKRAEVRNPQEIEEICGTRRDCVDPTEKGVRDCGAHLTIDRQRPLYIWFNEAKFLFKLSAFRGGTFHLILIYDTNMHLSIPTLTAVVSTENSYCHGPFLPAWSCRRERCYGIYIGSDTGQWATPANGPSPYLMSILDSQILNLPFEIAIKYGDGPLAGVARWPVSEPRVDIAICWSEAWKQENER
jgi:hypothetical protein